MEQEFYNQNTIIVKRLMSKIEQLSQGDLSDPALLKQITQLVNLASKISRIKIPTPIKPVAEARAAATKASPIPASAGMTPVSTGVTPSAVGSSPASREAVLAQEQPLPRNRAERRRMERKKRHST